MIIKNWGTNQSVLYVYNFVHETSKDKKWSFEGMCPLRVSWSNVCSSSFILLLLTLTSTAMFVLNPMFETSSTAAHLSRFSLDGAPYQSQKPTWNMCPRTRTVVSIGVFNLPVVLTWQFKKWNIWMKETKILVFFLWLKSVLCSHLFISSAVQHHLLSIFWEVDTLYNGKSQEGDTLYNGKSLEGDILYNGKSWKEYSC